MWSLKRLFKGAWGEIDALVKTGKCEVTEFIDELESQDDSAHQKILAVLTKMSVYGPVNNINQFRRARDNLYEIKSKHIRFFCCYDKRKGRLIILISAMRKSGHKEQTRNINRAVRVRNEYFEYQYGEKLE
ncbi:type II toxin-antitoxin system RelE/ParE family toxin [bacterium]|nr:type II toxin-antitoxin system RelE/ParE family toxin [bacterium]